MGGNARTKIYWVKSSTSLKTNLYIATAFLFTIGNVTWRWFDDPVYFYVPLALFLLMGVVVVKTGGKKITIRQDIFLEWIMLMAMGNVIKQVWYNNADVKQINDYWWGAFLALFFIPKVIFPNIYSKRKIGNKRWETRTKVLENWQKHG